MSDIDHRIERAIREGEEVLIGQLGDPPNEEAWADLADMVIGDLAEDYLGAVTALREIVEADWVDLALDPTWAQRIAEAALKL